MPELHTSSAGGVLVPPVPAAPAAPVPPSFVLPDRWPAAPPASLQPPSFAHPVVLVDPRPWALVAARSLRARGVPIFVLSADRFEPTAHTRGARRRRLPPIRQHPERWEAALLELAARLEPRPIVMTCSATALALARTIGRRLEPHFILLGTRTIEPAPAAPDPDAALRAALRRGEPALEVQLVRDATGRRTGQCVLAWAPGAPQEFVVTSVEGAEVAVQSEAHLALHAYTGYARLVWAPDRFGRLVLQAASPLPSASLVLAHEDGVDLATLAYAAALSGALPPQRPQLVLTRRFTLVDMENDATPLLQVRPSPSRHDPLPYVVALARALLHA
jgi:hypothetical protein